LLLTQEILFLPPESIMKLSRMN